MQSCLRIYSAELKSFAGRDPQKLRDPPLSAFSVRVLVLQLLVPCIMVAT